MLRATNIEESRAKQFSQARSNQPWLFFPVLKMPEKVVNFGKSGWRDVSHLRLLSYLAFLACPTQGSSRYPCSPFSPQKTNSCQLWGKQTEAWKSPSLMTALNQTSPFAICWRARICKLPCFKGKSYTKLNRKKKNLSWLLKTSVNVWRLQNFLMTHNV